MLDQANAVFRRASVADIPEMSVIRLSVKENVLSNPGRVTVQMYEDYLEKDGQGWVAEQDGAIVAFSYADKNDGSIWALFVSPDHEGKGLATNLLKLAVDWLFGLGHQRITLHTSPDTRADRFYARQGWRRGSIQGTQVEYILEHSVSTVMNKEPISLPASSAGSYPEHLLVTRVEQLATLFDQVAPASYLKQVSFIHPHYRAMIEASPFAVLATSGPNGLDASPRLRSKLWDLPSAGTRPDTVPSAGTILAALSEGHIDSDAYDHAAPARQRATLY